MANPERPVTTLSRLALAAVPTAAVALSYAYAYSICGTTLGWDDLGAAALIDVFATAAWLDFIPSPDWPSE